eukprot:scpid103035/ scgid12192/ 
MYIVLHNSSNRWETSIQEVRTLPPDSNSCSQGNVNCLPRNALHKSNFISRIAECDNPVQVTCDVRDGFCDARSLVSTSESVTIVVNCEMNDVTSFPNLTQGCSGVVGPIITSSIAIPTKTLCLVLLVGACQVWITG